MQGKLYIDDKDDAVRSCLVVEDGELRWPAPPPAVAPKAGRAPPAAEALSPEESAARAAEATAAAAQVGVPKRSTHRCSSACYN